MTTPRGRGRRSARKDGERGVTLIELVVAMGLAVVLFTIVTVGFVALYRSTDRSESISLTSADVATVFSQLDGTIRYASTISEPGTGADGAWYVEWGATNEVQPQCFQLRLNADAGVLAIRRWSLDSTADAVDLTDWHALATRVAEPTAAPFLRLTGPSQPHQQLRIRFVSASGQPGIGDSTEFNNTFTALNSQNDGANTMCAGVDRS